jgi:murein DD-endopeptidase MepM/ murein hydrolase activator NlpD
MRFSGNDNAVRVVLCAAVVACGLTGAAAQRTAIAIRAPMPRTLAVAPAPVMLTSHQVGRSVHPAADPLLGERWAASRRLIMPVAGITADDLVDTFSQVRGPNRRHEAIDIRAPRGAAVVAVTNGEILRLTEHDSGGITLYLLAPDGQTMFYYAHLLRYADGVRPGVRVRQGDVIAYVGDTGNAGPGNYHLHFEVMTAPDPRQYHAARPRNPYPLLLRARG